MSDKMSEVTKIMARIKMTISIPENTRDFVEYRVDRAGYGSVSEYIRELIRMDQRRELERMDEAVSRSPDERQQRNRPL